MILDFHTHVFPDALARKAMITMGERTLIPFYTDGSVEQLRASMEASGVTHSVICNIAVKPGQTESVLRFAKGLLADAGQSPHLIPLASIHPFEEKRSALLREIRDGGFRGIKLHPDYQDFYINDPSLESFYREVFSLGLFILFHTGVDKGYPEPVHATPDQILDILPVLEEGTTILAHMGGNDYCDEVERLLCGRNLYIDTSYNLDKMPVEQARRIISAHGPERMLFATDSPWTDQKRYLDYFQSEVAEGFLSPRQRRSILWDNGAALLGLT
ncbi:MAG: amidohydrolase family protein [Oscillospiraceae bacterium]